MPVFTPFVPQPKPAKPSKASVSKKPAAMRRHPLEEKIYGDELFEMAMTPAKVVYIGFHELINEKTTRISKCKRFIIEYFPHHHTQVLEVPVEDGEPLLQVDVEAFNFFYFKDVQPIMTYNPHNDTSFTIPIEAATEKLLATEDLKQIEEKIIALVRLEELENMKKENENVESTTNTADAANNVAGAADSPTIISNSVTENVELQTQSTIEEEVCNKESEETNKDGVAEQKTGQRFTSIN